MKVPQAQYIKDFNMKFSILEKLSSCDTLCLFLSLSTLSLTHTYIHTLSLLMFPDTSVTPTKQNSPHNQMMGTGLTL